MAAILRDSVAVVRTRTGAVPLAMIITITLLSYMGMGLRLPALRLAALRVAGAPL